MAKTDAPNVEEIVGHNITERGTRFFRKIKRIQPITEHQLRAAANKVYNRTGIEYRNLLFIGVKKGKFIFMPLLDLE
ncbi:hypothetical protein KKE06_04855 [Candidatus Micrarchaeota archaeon]|nr:hypothetical protein [Candidatus Micrarchaeota archaeon]MBU1931045.1 hypothetical protein [Candidatus Micrarchaeota archaeon]